MQNQFIKKVIRASAGTGKTYRLSLEYIALLLKFRELNIHFSEILVITFTKKATAEIRERIFQHLQALSRETQEGRVLSSNLDAILGVKITRDDIAYLGRIYHEMLMNKNRVQISTIDSFTNSLFATIISPYLGITSYEVTDSLEDDDLAEIYQFLLENEENLKKTLALFTRGGRKKISDYERFILSLLNNRWIFHFVDEFAPQKKYSNNADELMHQYVQNFRQIYRDIISRFQAYLVNEQIEKSADQILKKDFYDILVTENHSSPDLAGLFKSKIENVDFLREHQRLFLDGRPFWHGGKMLRKKQHRELKEELEAKISDAAEALAEYLFYADLLPEENEIREIAELVYKKYDEIKFRNKVFTYNDISYYTFKYLYDPGLSLVEGDSVTNAFYEYLANRTRFILIDEFQDTSIVQFKILLPIIREVISGAGLKDYGGAIVVGDEKQSIYGWRGGERDLLLQMPHILLEAEQASLDVSFRSNRALLGFINSVFANERLHAHLADRDITWPYQSVKSATESNDGCVQIRFRNYSNTKQDDNDISRHEDTLREFIDKMLIPLVQENKIDAAGTAILARKNDDLVKMASILDEWRIPYVLNSSASILNHRAVKPMMFLLRYFVYKDIFELLRFLRSDYVLMHAGELQQVLLAYRDLAADHSSSEDLFKSLTHIPVMEKISSLNNHADLVQTGSFELLNFVKEICEEFNVINLFPLESDIKNLNLFLHLVADFENSKSDAAKTLTGFVGFCQEMEQSEAWQQLGLEDIHAIHLMTIHKSKGLEFNNVFLYWDISSRSGSSSGTLHTYLDYTADFGRIKDFAMTLNFNHILPVCSKKSLRENRDIRAAIEELNNFYVALTRAKSNLFLYLAFKKSGGLEKLMTDIQSSEAPTIGEVFYATIYDILREEKAEGDQVFAQFGRLASVVKTESKEAEKDFSFIKKYMNLNRDEFLVADSEIIELEKHLDFKSTFIENRDIDRGNVAHYYLSFVKYATKDQMDYAAERTISYYGNLFRQDEIMSLINQVNIFIYKHPAYFSQTDWPNVFTEHTLFHPSGREVRLDRLMINEMRKEILIIDYKTGEFFKSSQMQEYIETVEALPVVKESGYGVKGEFVEIQL